MMENVTKRYNPRNPRNHSFEWLMDTLNAWLSQKVARFHYVASNKSHFNCF